MWRTTRASHLLLCLRFLRQGGSSCSAAKFGVLSHSEGESLRIGIDLMGGDTPPDDLFQAVVAASRELEADDLLLALVSQDKKEKFSAVLNSLPPGRAAGQIGFVVASEVVSMTDSPRQALRRKKDSSLWKGIRLLKEGEIEAFVSPGNTGALMLAAAISLSSLPGIDRPALLATLPTTRGRVVVLDVGGNVSVKAKHLVQFAKMGAAYQQCSGGPSRPAVGLLNIGVESLKGTSGVREAYRDLEAYACRSIGHPCQLSFAGNVEGRDVFQGKVDVLVTDGFAGNVFLKTAEGASAFIVEQMHRALLPDNVLLREAVRSLEKTVNYEEYPGAVLCGVNGILIKCHGYASPRGMLNAIRGAVTLLRHRLLYKITEVLK